MSIILYGLKNCDTCKKAMKALEGAGRDVQFVDIRAEADLAALLPVWLAEAGPDKLINRRSTTWRNLSDEERESEPGALLLEHPTLIKRPVILSEDRVLVGWSTDVQGTFL